jgi:glycosyltransferase involved in cell wall biosynthesis
MIRTRGIGSYIYAGTIDNMKILHICGSFETGGIATVVRSIIQLNQQSDTRHDLLLLYEKQRNSLQRANVYSLEDIIKHPLKVFLRMKKILAHYDGIMIHKMHPIIFPPLFFSGKKLFLFQHGMTVSRGNPVKRLIKRTWYSIVPALLKAKIICSTDYAYQKARRNGIRLSKKRTAIVPLGIGLPGKKERNIDKKRWEEEIIVGSAGNLAKIKRFDWLLKSLMNYSGNAKLVIKIAGDGPERNLLRELEKKICSKNVEVDFLGYVDDMDDFYDNLDIFVFSGHNESFGLVILEALARMVPVVVFTDLGGALSLVKDNVNGFILEPGIPGLEEFWKRLNENPDMIEKVVRNLSRLDLGDYDIASTRSKLENMVLNSG